MINKDNLQNVRRALELGLRVAQEDKDSPVKYVDIFQHALDELQRAGLKFPDELTR